MRFLVNILFVSLLSSLAFSQSPLEAVKGKKEEVNKRDLFSKHYVNEDGSYTALIGSGPIHYEKDGQFLDIDHTIVPNSISGDFPFVNKTNLMESYFGSTALKGIQSVTKEGAVSEFLQPQMYWEVNGNSVNVQNGADVPVSINGNKVVYNNLFGNISAEFTILTGKRELNYIIPDNNALGNIPANADYLVFSENIELPQGWTFEETEKGILIKNVLGEKVYFYENPVSFDANSLVTLRSESNTIFETSLNGTILTIKTKVKTDWLLNDARVFPIKVDPTNNYYATGSRSVASDGSEETLGLFGASDGYEVSYHIKFNTSGIPNGSTINSVTGYLYVYGHGGSFWNGGNPYEAFIFKNSSDPVTTSGSSLFNSATTVLSYRSQDLGYYYDWHDATLTNTGLTYIQNNYQNGSVSLATSPDGNYELNDFFGSRTHSDLNQEPYLSITYTTAASMTCGPLSNPTPSIGSPANGLQHHIQLNWDALSGATGYDVQYSTDGTNFTNASPASTSNNHYDFNAGDNPNTRYWFRVRAKDGSQTCQWTSFAPIYTAADFPAVPLLTNVGSTTLNLTLQAETPVANPAITEYSIVCPTTGQFVQANGTLGSTEVFQTSAQWGTVTVSGLTVGNNYCFYAKARNGDGHVVMDGNSFVVEAFNSDILVNGSNAPDNVWFAPSYNTPISWDNINGCPSGGGSIGYNANWNQNWGNFVRLPAQNLTGLNQVTMTFDLTNSLDIGTPIKNNFRFSLHDGNSYLYPPITASVGGNTYTPQGINNYFYLFDQARTCEKVTVTYDLSGVVNKSTLFFYIEVNSGYNNSTPFYFYIDNITLADTPPTACATTSAAPTPIFHNAGGSSQIAFNNSRHNSDEPTFRLHHNGGTANSYQIEINTQHDFSGTAITQTFNGSYPASTPTDFKVTNSAGQFTVGNTYYVRARVDAGAGWGNWTNDLFSYSYETSYLNVVPNWYQSTTPQFNTGILNNTVSTTDFVTVTAPSGGGGNPFTDPSFETGAGWSVSQSFTAYETYLTTDDQGTNGITDGNMCVIFTEDDYSWQSFYNGEYSNVSQQVDLTGVDAIQFDVTHWRNTQSQIYNCGVGRACKVVWSFQVIVGDAGTASNNSGTVVYNWTPTTAEFAVTNNYDVIVDLTPYGFTGTKTVKFAKVVTDGGGVWYDDDKYYLDNIRGVSNPTNSGTITSTPISYSWANGATGYFKLIWDQDLNGGSISFDLQNYDVATSSWVNIPGYTNIQDASSDGVKDYDLSNMTAYDSIRIVGHLTGLNATFMPEAGTGGLEEIYQPKAGGDGVKLNYWSVKFQHNGQLPVELIDFSLNCENNIPHISWQTASELNSESFTIEYSEDGKKWRYLTSLEAAGNSSTMRYYSARGIENTNSEVIYYRLIQRDFDGEEEVFGPISANCNSLNNGITAFPNPNQGEFNLSITNNKTETAELFIFNTQGSVVYQKSVELKKGNQLIPVRTTLKKGVYFLKLKNEKGDFETVKVVIGG